MTGVEVDTEGATYIPTLSILAMRPWIATTLTLFGPHLLPCDKSSFLGAGSWVSPVITDLLVVIVTTCCIVSSVCLTHGLWPSRLNTLYIHVHTRACRRTLVGALGFSAAVGSQTAIHRAFRFLSRPTIPCARWVHSCA